MSSLSGSTWPRLLGMASTSRKLQSRYHHGMALDTDRHVRNQRRSKGGGRGVATAGCARLVTRFASKSMKEDGVRLT